VRTVTVVPKEKIELIPLAQIVNKFDVRIALDEDRVVQFAGLYEGGVSLPPVRLVKVDDDQFAYIDGRTRGAARAYLNLPNVPAVICNGSLRDDPVELFAEALESNWGGAKPPTRDDITHTLLRMLELGATMKAIRERLRFLPMGAMNAYLAHARSVLAKRRLSKALDAVAEGVSVKTAAEMHKVKPEHLKDVISGKKGRWGASRSEEQQIAVEVKAYISRSLFSANAGIAKKVEGALKKVEEGEMSAAVASSIVHAWAEHIRKSAIRIEDWKARLTAITAEQDKAVAAP
jgi:hypothetical protein